MEIIVNLDVMMARRKISAGELAERVGGGPDRDADLDLVAVSAVSAVAAVAGAAGQAGQTSDATGESGVLEEVPPRNVAHSVSFPSCCFPHLRLMRKFTENNE